jgi:ABC-type Zn uptake system ZnuABC Zn-binding protein ZnuA
MNLSQYMLQIISAIVIVISGYRLPEAGDLLRVVITTPDLKSIAEQIGGDRLQVFSLAHGRQDPHFVEAKPSLMMKARRADLFIRIGLDLEVGYERLIIEGSRNGKIRIGEPGHLDCSRGVMRLEVPVGKVDRAEGDIHPFGNPHYWLDPLNAVAMGKNIQERLSEIDPAHDREYRNNFERFRNKIYGLLYGEKLVQEIGGEHLARADQEGKLWEFLEEQSKRGDLRGWRGRLAPFRGRRIITYHRSWPYFLHRFELIEAETLEPKPGIPPSPGHILKVIRKMKKEKIRVVLMEVFYDDKPARLVAKKAGAGIVKVANSVGGTQEAEDYFMLIDSIVRHLSAAMEKR